MLSKVLRPVLKSGEALAAGQVQTTTNTRYTRKVLRPVLQSGEALAAVQVQTTTNTNYGK